MSAAAREIHHIALTVRDMKASEAFYGGVMGLRRTLEMPIRDPRTIRVMGLPEGATGHSVYFQGPTRIGQLELIEWRGHGRTDTGPKRPGDPGVFLLSFEVSRDELDEIWERGVAAGTPVQAEPADAVLENYGTIRVAIFIDPDGVLVELVALPTKEEIAAFRAANPRASL
ncbi:MAG: VOC family protein [Sphingobium sp.]